MNETVLFMLCFVLEGKLLLLGSTAIKGPKGSQGDLKHNRSLTAEASVLLQSKNPCIDVHPVNNVSAFLIRSSFGHKSQAHLTLAPLRKASAVLIFSLEINMLLQTISFHSLP